MTNFSNIAVDTTLDGAINDVVTSLVVISATGYPAVPFNVHIETEVIRVRAKSGTTFSDLVRGYDGTSAASHATAEAVTHVVIAEDIILPVDYIALIGPFPVSTTGNADKSKGGRFYVSHALIATTQSAWAGTWVNGETYVFKLFKFNPGGSMVVDSVVAEKSYEADGTEGADSLVTVTFDTPAELTEGEIYGVICYRSAGSFPSRYGPNLTVVGPGMTGMNGIRVNSDVVASTTLISVATMYSGEMNGTF